MAQKVPPVINPGVDVGEHLVWLVGQTGAVQNAGAGYRIKIYHAGMFPWAEVFKDLVYRDFKVYVTRHKADLYIDAQP